MSREVRRVAGDWVHPYRVVMERVRFFDESEPLTPRARLVPLLPESFREACEEWDREAVAWPGSDTANRTWSAESVERIRAEIEKRRALKGTLTAEEEELPDVGTPVWESFEDYAGARPTDPGLYMPDWPAEARTHWQAYETVTEGTPISPVFPTAEALVEWLVTEARWTRGQAEALVRHGHAMSLVSVGGEVMTGVEYLARVDAGG